MGLIRDFLNIARWKEYWITVSLPICLLGPPCALIAVLLVVPQPWPIVIFTISLVFACIGSAYGDPDNRR